MTRWTIGAVGGALVILAIIAGATSRTATLRALVIKTLGERLDSEIEMADFSVDTFPTVHITGSGLIIRHKGRHDVPPLVSIRSFTIEGGLFGLLARPRRFRIVTLTGLEVNIPPGGFKRAVGETTAAGGTIAFTGQKPDDGSGPAAIVVDRLLAEDASLVLIPRRADKKPKVFAIHHLTLEPLGKTKVMAFTAQITNPLPKGLVEANGTFGPWGRDDPGNTPLNGRYTFNHADLSTIKGIGGMLDSTGTFGGQLDRIGVSGETRTPDFRVVTGQPVPLETKFDAVVDGTDGDTYLNAVSAKFLNTPLTAKGAIVGAEGVKGRFVKIHVKIDNGRIEDVLRLAIKNEQPLMTGHLALDADLNLPAGPEEVMDRLELSGDLDVRSARFNGVVQSKISDMSERARGLDPVESSQSVASTLRTKFRLDRGVLTLQDAIFGIPGATVLMGGSYGLKNEVLAFDGTVRMQAKISQAVGGGVKGVLLKAIDPLFRKDGAGAVIPIKVRGNRAKPDVGLDVSRVFHKQATDEHGKTPKP